MNKDYAVEACLSFTYENKKKPALKNAEIKIEKGSCTVICGSSGCGKSTLLRCINRLIPNFYEGELQGKCYISGQDTENFSVGEAGRRAATVFQDPRSQFFTMNSTTEAAFGLENAGCEPEIMRKKVDEAFASLDALYLKDRNVFTLSAGQKQNVAVISSCTEDTDIILMDEPTANLDYSAVIKLRQMIISLKNQGKTIIISEHRLWYLSGIADSYIYMKDGEIQDNFSSEEFLSFTEEKLHSLGLRTTNQKNIKNNIKTEAEGSFEIRCENLGFSYKKGRPVLKGLSFSGKAGQAVCLAGENGCGKTTAGKLISGLLKKKQGKIFINGREASRKMLTEATVFVMQEAEFQFFTNSVLNEIFYPKKPDRKMISEAEEILRKTGLWELRHCHPFSLSGGQMQKLSLLCAYFSDKKAAVLDEPTAGLDFDSMKICCEIINRMKETKAVFIITHDRELIAQVCTRGVFIENGINKKEYMLSDSRAFDMLSEDMEKEDIKREEPEIKKKKPLIHPGVKLFIMLCSMVIGVFTDLPLMLCAFMGVFAAALYERQFKAGFGGFISLSVLMLLYYLFPDTVFSFIGNFFPRIILIGTAAAINIDFDHAPVTLAGMRELHIPEKIIMICSVMFRFFPVLNGDMALMKQAVKTRGFFPELKDKIKALPSYGEILIVPMVFRVIRIAEALSASAETRGIALKNRRTSYIEVKGSFSDIVIFFLYTALAVTGIII